MESVLLAQNGHWEKRYEGLFRREVFEKLKRYLAVPHIQVVQGIRRSGKSTLFKLMINHLTDSIDPEEILYVNLDDPYFIPYGDDPAFFHEIVKTARKLTQKRVKYLFLDEVQNIRGWERYVKSVYDSGEFTKIFVTGSNASLLNGAFATLLGGRYLSVRVHPLSFKEILFIEGITDYKTLVKVFPRLVHSYLFKVPSKSEESCICRAVDCQYISSAMKHPNFWME